MGIGFKLHLKWGFPLQSHPLPDSPSRLSSSSVRGREAYISSASLSFLSNISEEGDTCYRNLLNAKACSFASPQTLDGGSLKFEEMKINIGKRSGSNLRNMIDGNQRLGEGRYTSQISLETCNISQFRLLVQNLDTLEGTFVDSNISLLEKDILKQLEKLGARKLFDTRLSRTLRASNLFDLSDVPIGNIKDPETNTIMGDQIGKTFVCSGKKAERKSRRARASENSNKMSSISLPLKAVRKGFQKPTLSSRGRRTMIARNEAEMSRGVKVIADLERIKTILEKETGRIATLSSWAEAAGVDKKDLHQHLLYGWYCRDELLRSTRSLVLYLARNYRGLGIAHEDLLQSGNLGVLQGAERFDHTRGYKLSTYVQYWIRKSMSRTVAQHARGVKIPYTLSRVINQIQKARRSLSSIHGNFPDDTEIAKATGLSLEKIGTAKKCFRVVGSIDQKLEDCFSVKYMELTPDISVPNPEESVMRQHMIKGIYDLLKCLDQREMQVLVLRFGLHNHHPKSLEEIGRIFHVSKEWIRRVEKKALTNLRNAENGRELGHYLSGGVIVI
uniref:Sigma factor n=1 Tax=Melianthus villosus TaxID=377280 RepID=A0A0G2STQ0_9ROSI|nr:sigma factor [Melianthus villosus]